MDAQNVIKLLEGNWIFTRSITGYGPMNGVAVFVKMGSDRDSLGYREDLKFPAPNGQLLTGHREYLYTTKNEGTVSVYFKRDKTVGELFLEMPVTTNTFSGTHHCLRDSYHGSIELVGNDTFTITYKIIGPNKNHIHKTEYIRA